MTLSEIKNSVEILEVAENLGISVDPTTKRACCPFHEDKTPSLQFSVEKQIATCFSSNCSAGTMDVITLTEKKLNTTTHEALNYLSGMTSTQTQKPEPKQKENYQEDFTIVKKVLAVSSTARNYLKSRNIDRKVLELGFNALLTPKLNYLKGCVVFPLKNSHGQIVSLYGRSVKNNDKAKHYYTSNRQGLYPNYPEGGTLKLILTESVIDAATLLSIKNIKENYEILALYGTNGFNEEHTKAINALTELEEIILFLDGDKGGRTATANYTKQLKEAYPDIIISLVETLENEDINSIAQSHEPEVFEELLNNRILFSSDEGRQPNKEQAAPTGNKKVESHLDTTNNDRITYKVEELIITIWGGIEYGNLHRLKLSLNLENPKNSNTFRDEVNLYSNRSKKGFLQDAAEELDYQESNLKNILNTFTKEVEEYRLKKKEEFKLLERPKIKKLNIKEIQEAELLLKDKKIIEIVKNTLKNIGMIGEINNGMLLFLIFLTRNFEKPLHALVHGSSGSGKTNLLKSVLKLVPGESKYETTALTENVLFRPLYKDFWKNKILLLEDLGRLLQSPITPKRTHE